MKHFFLLLLALALAGAASAQRLQLGVRGGINTVDQRFDPVEIDGTRITAGGCRVGYDVGFALRLNFTRHFHLQAEANYVFANYGYQLSGKYTRSAQLRNERLEFPVELGIHIGKVVRLFGGAVFRAAESQHSTAGHIFRASFNDRDIAIIGGIGLDIGKFFLDFRVSGYPDAHSWNTFTVANSAPRRIRVGRTLTYGGSIGFFF